MRVSICRAYAGSGAQPVPSLHARQADQRAAVVEPGRREEKPGLHFIDEPARAVADIADRLLVPRGIGPLRDALVRDLLLSRPDQRHASRLYATDYATTATREDRMAVGVEA